MRIQISFDFSKETEHEYGYYSNNIGKPNYLLTSASHEVHHDIIHGVPHTNVIRYEEKSNQIRIRILFGLKIATKYGYKYYSA